MVIKNKLQLKHYLRRFNSEVIDMYLSPSSTSINIFLITNWHLISMGEMLLFNLNEIKIYLGHLAT